MLNGITKKLYVLNFAHIIKEKWKVWVENRIHYQVNDNGHCADFHEAHVPQQIFVKGSDTNTLNFRKKV